MFDRNPQLQSIDLFPSLPGRLRAITFYFRAWSLRRRRANRSASSSGSSEVPHLADEPHGDLPSSAGHLHLRAVDRRPLEALVVAPQQARGAAPAGVLAVPEGMNERRHGFWGLRTRNTDPAKSVPFQTDVSHRNAAP